MGQDPQFGTWLRERRNALDLAQWELAERIGCSRDTIQKIESGTRRPSKQVAELLADCLGVAPGERAAFVNWARLGLRSTPPGSVPALSLPLSSQAPVNSSPYINVPTPLTVLIGREHAIEAVCEYLTRDDVRLLSLIGPPGVGKTRLGIAAARSMAAAFRDGIHFVALETVTDPALVVPTIAEALKISTRGRAATLDALAAHLRGQHVLLVLDNLEQVLDAGLQVIELIRACPELKIIVTTREALHVYGEWRFVVRPLKLPDISRLSEQRPEIVSHVSAVALFIQRAQAIKSDLALSAGDLEVIAKICARLDGLPLAIELAATRVSSLSLREILSGLGQLQLLRGNFRNLPPRQRTIREAIEWSYRMLPSPEQALFRRVGVFVGGCTRAAAESVCNSADLDSHDAASNVDLTVMEGCQSLIEKSLLRHELRKANEDGEDRYAMLEVLREYAVEQLQSSGEQDRLRRRHAQYFLAVAEAAAPQLNGPEQAKVLRELEADKDNIRSALAWSLEGGPATREIALRLSGSLGKFWDIRGYAGEGRRWLERALANASDPIPNDGRADITESAATIPPVVRLRALMATGSLASVQGDHLAARGYHRQALEVAQAAGHKVGICRTLQNLALVCNHLGDYSEALALYEQALAMSRELGDQGDIGRTLFNMGFMTQSMGDNVKARALYEESLAVRRQVGDQYGIAMALGNLGQIAAEQGDCTQARALFETSLSIRREIRDERGTAFCLLRLADLERIEHHSAQARELYHQALVIYRQVGDQEGIAYCLEWLPELCTGTVQIEQGVRLWGAAEALRRSIHASMTLAHRSRYNAAVARARAELGEETFARASAEGNQMTTQDAIDRALELLPQLSSGVPPASG